MHHTKHDTADATTTATDPVCGMSVTVNDDAITRQYGGESYYFCSEHCARTFDASPKEYADKA
jgi:Cu+-exporting ATPase